MGQSISCREAVVDRPRATLVIAERNANIRELLRREFGREGYAVLTAGSGAEVLSQLFLAQRVDLLVLDAEMGGPDGSALAPRLEREFPRLPVVLHGFAGFESGESGVARVEKGADFERLKRTVREVLSAEANDD
jgi:CheY-like chemotaxis protein